MTDAISALFMLHTPSGGVRTVIAGFRLYSESGVEIFRRHFNRPYFADDHVWLWDFKLACDIVEDPSITDPTQLLERPGL